MTMKAFDDDYCILFRRFADFFFFVVVINPVHSSPFFGAFGNRTTTGTLAASRKFIYPVPPKQPCTQHEHKAHIYAFSLQK